MNRNGRNSPDMPDGSHVVILNANGHAICTIRTVNMYAIAAGLMIGEIVEINSVRHEVIARGTAHISGMIKEGRKLQSWSYDKTTITVAITKRKPALAKLAIRIEAK